MIASVWQSQLYEAGSLAQESCPQRLHVKPLHNKTTLKRTVQISVDIPTFAAEK